MIVFTYFFNTLFLLLFAIFLKAESPEADYYEMNIPPAALERAAKNGDPDAMFDYGNCLYDGICKGIGIDNKQLIKRDAHIFGISNYDDSLLDISQPVNDAIDFDNYLKKNDYTTSLYKDPDLTKFSLFKSRLSRLEYKNSSYDRHDVIFYYSGHGVNIKGKNYIIPRDFNGSEDNILSLVSLNEIISVLEKTYDGIKILIFDACRNEGDVDEETKTATLYENKDGQLKFNLPNSGLAPIKAGPNTYIIYASSPGEVSLAIKGIRNSVFTNEFIETLESDDGLNIDEVMMQTRDRVMITTKFAKKVQVPWNESSLNEHYYISYRETNKNEKELGVYWISRAAAMGNEPALSMMAAFYCSGEIGIPKNPSKGMQIYDDLIQNSNDPQVLQIVNYFKDYCDVDVSPTNQIDQASFIFNGLADIICENDVCLDFIALKLKNSELLDELTALKIITMAGSLDERDDTNTYSFSLYSVLKDSPEVFEVIYAQLKGGLYKEELAFLKKQVGENDFLEEYILVTEIRELALGGFKEAHESGSDF